MGCVRTALAAAADAVVEAGLGDQLRLGRLGKQLPRLGGRA